MACIIPTLLVLLLAPATTAATTDAPTTAESIGNIGSLQASSAPPPEGGTRICDGKSREGWKQIPQDSWTVKSGVRPSLGAARGVIYTTGEYDSSRVTFDIRHVSGNKDHRAC